MSIVTIDDAKRRYRDYRPESEGYRQLITVLIDAGFDQSFKNDSYYDALILTEAMFDRSSRCIKLLTGSAGDGFLCELAGPFTSALERIKMNNGTVKLVILSNQLPSGLAELAKRFVGTLEIALAKTSSKLRHFIVCDGKIVRLEEFHGPLDGSTSAHEIKAQVNFHSPEQARTLETLFDAMWGSLVPRRSV